MTGWCGGLHMEPEVDPDTETKDAVGGHHVPGTPFNWRHNWEPLNAQTARAHGLPWGNGGSGKKPSGGKPSGTPKPKPKPIQPGDRVQLPDNRAGRVVLKTEDGKLAVLWDDGQAGTYSPDEVFQEGQLPKGEQSGGKTKASKRTSAKHKTVEAWLDKGDLLDSGKGGAGGDETLSNIWKEQGFDGLPNVVAEDDLDKEIAAGGLELWRGIANRSDTEGEAEGYAKQFLYADEPYPGLGVYGNGTYATPDGEFASRYTRSLGDKEGSLTRMALRPGSRTVTYEDLLSQMFEARDAAESGGDPRIRDAITDLGRMASMLGYDAILAGTKDGQSPPSEVVILNRTAVSISSYIRKAKR